MNQGFSPWDTISSEPKPFSAGCLSRLAEFGFVKNRSGTENRPF
jgi:hypothetical protein